MESDMRERTPTRVISTRYFPIHLACTVEVCNAPTLRDCISCSYLKIRRMKYTKEEI